jgi:hypothetical protein
LYVFDRPALLSTVFFDFANFPALYVGFVLLLLGDLSQQLLVLNR